MEEIGKNDFLTCMLQKLQHCHLQTKDIVLELVGLHSDVDYSRLSVYTKMLKQEGFEISMDDFGSGQGTLKAWSELTPNYVKLDQYFINNTGENTSKRHIVRAIRVLANDMGCKLIATGVETFQEMEVAVESDVDMVHGYLFGFPVQTPNVPDKLG